MHIYCFSLISYEKMATVQEKVKKLKEDAEYLASKEDELTERRLDMRIKLRVSAGICTFRSR